MKTITEFYPKKQGRPASTRTVDFESGQTLDYYYLIYLKGDYSKVEDLLDKLLNEQIQQLDQMLIEIKQIKLHLAAISEEAIDENDID